MMKSGMEHTESEEGQAQSSNLSWKTDIISKVKGPNSKGKIRYVGKVTTPSQQQHSSKPKNEYMTIMMERLMEQNQNLTNLVSNVLMHVAMHVGSGQQDELLNFLNEARIIASVEIQISFLYFLP